MWRVGLTITTLEVSPNHMHSWGQKYGTVGMTGNSMQQHKLRSIFLDSRDVAVPRFNGARKDTAVAHHSDPA